MEAITRVCLIGPESTGKSALAERLARELGATSVREFARDYAEARGNRLSFEDCEPIARGQVALEEAESRARAAGVLILDTDLISTVVYARHYYSRCPEWIVDEARRRRASLYLLMSTDVPWISDAARDAGGDRRERLFDEFRAALEEFDTRWVMISGDWEERFRSAVAAISATVSRQPGTEL